MAVVATAYKYTHGERVIRAGGLLTAAEAPEIVTILTPPPGPAAVLSVADSAGPVLYRPAETVPRYFAPGADCDDRSERISARPYSPYPSRTLHGSPAWGR